MKTPKIVDNCPVCEPIMNLLEIMLDNGYIITEQRCSDYHFHELTFIVSSKEMNKELKVEVNHIHMHESGIYYCDCHWSTIGFAPL